MKKINLILLICLICLNGKMAFGYKIHDKVTKEDVFEMVPQSDGIYKVFTKVDHLPRSLIYQTLPDDVDWISFQVCGGDDIAQLDFTYSDEKKFPTQSVFFNMKKTDVSPVYPHQDWLCASKFPLIVSWRESNEMEEEYNTLIILQPIFKTQAPVWIVIGRLFNIPFPGGVGKASSEFTKNGNLYLALEVEIKDNPRSIKDVRLTASETIPIPYSIFKKPVSKPTCYIMPEDHKLRLCNVEEAKLRTPALKAFLGET